MYCRLPHQHASHRDRGSLLSSYVGCVVFSVIMQLQDRTYGYVGSENNCIKVDTFCSTYCIATLQWYVTTVRNSVLLFIFSGQKDVTQVPFTLRCVQHMVTSVL